MTNTLSTGDEGAVELAKSESVDTEDLYDCGITESLKEKLRALTDKQIYC